MTTEPALHLAPPSPTCWHSTYVRIFVTPCVSNVQQRDFPRMDEDDNIDRQLSSYTELDFECASTSVNTKPSSHVVGKKCVSCVRNDWVISSEMNVNLVTYRVWKEDFSNKMRCIGIRRKGEVRRNPRLWHLRQCRRDWRRRPRQATQSGWARAGCRTSRRHP